MYWLSLAVRRFHCSEKGIPLAHAPLQWSIEHTIRAYFVQKLEEDPIHFRAVLLWDLIAVTTASVTVNSRVEVVR